MYDNRSFAVSNYHLSKKKFSTILNLTKYQLTEYQFQVLISRIKEEYYKGNPIIVKLVKEISNIPLNNNHSKLIEDIITRFIAEFFYIAGKNILFH
jgi:hypothetical protein